MQQQKSIARRPGGELRRTLGGLGRFARSTRGGLSATFALLAVPLTCASLGAVDYARIIAIKTRLQDALDAATLSVGRSSTVTTNTAAQQLGSAMLGANLKPYSGAQLQSSAFTLVGSKVVSSASVSVTPIVAGVFTGGNVTVGATSEVVRAVNKLEVAMVLDNTGSMAGSKISLLKTAASNFVDTLSSAASRSSDPDAVKIALVPFSMTVNVGSSYKTASWMDQTGAAPINDQMFSAHVNRFTLFQTLGVNWAGCVESRQAPYDVQDTAPTTSTPATLFTPYFAPDEPDLTGYYNSYRNDGSTSTWSVRQANAAKYNGAPTRTGANAVGYQYGPNSGCQLTPLVRLTTDWTGLKTSINNMYAIGDTNIPMGMVWGWHVLSPNAPFADGVAYGTPKTTKVVVMMTDGQNANAVTSNGDASIYSGIGYIWQNRVGITSGTATQRQSALDSRLTTLCTNMKAQGIVIYTVRVEVNDTNYAVLQNCASTPDKFYDVQDASQLNSVFNAIAGAIENLRLSA